MNETTKACQTTLSQKLTQEYSNNCVKGSEINLYNCDLLLNQSNGPPIE